MRYLTDCITVAPTDLSNFLGCRHLTALDTLAARGELARPAQFGPLTEELQARGAAHELAYLAHLEAQGLQVARHTSPELGARSEPLCLEATLAAMRAGADVIYQATLGDARWSGRADFLRRVNSPSNLGEWSYEVVDTKLARDTRAGTILQLSVYSYLLGHLQGRQPDYMYVVVPSTEFEPKPYRTADYAAYFRLIARHLESFLEAPLSTYPELVAQCELCVWWDTCERQRRSDDHLCYVAGISRTQISVLREFGINRLAELARQDDLPRPTRGSHEALLRSHNQARVQWLGREQGQPYHELREPLDATHGLALLPEPSPGDIFLDFEGDHFAEDGVREYLTGWLIRGVDGTWEYTALWARTRSEERTAFENFIDAATAVRTRYPGSHVYHFAPYEPTALKRLMGRYATRELELDALLRGNAFVDLHTAVRRSLIASVERYSIKEIEPFFGYERQQSLREASYSRHAIEHALAAGDWDDTLERHRLIVEAYNREDCESALRLRDWLEHLRSEVIDAGGNLPRPALGDSSPSEKISELDAAIRELRERLLAGVPEESKDRTAEQQARFLLAHLMEFHRREDKASWWEYFRLLGLESEDYIDERRAVTGLEFDSLISESSAPACRYRFPAQELDARSRDGVFSDDGEKIGEVIAVNFAERMLDIKHTRKSATRRPYEAVLYNRVSSAVLQQSLMRFGNVVAEVGFGVESPYRTAEALLLRERPSLPSGNTSLQRLGETTIDAACRLALALDGGVLAIQGPPGTGKTYTAAHVICALCAAGLKVGVTAASHRVILNVLKGALEEAEKRSQSLRVFHKGDDDDRGAEGVRFIDDYDTVLNALAVDECDVVGATAWGWARPDFSESVDVLIVDEAGQMALANVLAAAHAGRSLILLGDPQQLEQPLQSTHPEGSEASALHHWLGGAETMPPDRGLFLAETHRLHPDIATFTSELYYEGKLRARPGLELQAILPSGDASPQVVGSGLRFYPVAHTGNTSRSAEEVATISHIVEDLLARSSWRNKSGEVAPLTVDDILIIAPYNAQVAALCEALPALQHRIGTVDRFQGQEAPVVICSMTSSSSEDAPRGMEFLYSRQRFNVATSRARALCIVVGSPALFEPNCSTPRQMQLANAFCRYLELAIEGA